MNKSMLLVLLVTIGIASCTRSLTETTPDASPARVTPIPPTAALLPLPSFTPITQPTFNGTDFFTVILLPAIEEVDILSTPGGSGSAVGTLQLAQSGVKRTGKSTSVGEDVWVEIQNPGGGTGWVESKYLTEHVTPAAFCADTRVPSLLDDLKRAVNTVDGELFKTLVSPAHGLDVVFIQDGMVANYSPDEASWAFQSTYLVEWGLGGGSGEPVSGTFPEVILPALQYVFTNLKTACNEIKLGDATYQVEWPERYGDINFYSLHNPGVDPAYGGLDWRTWLVGVEYVEQQPYLFALLHYQWEP